MKRALFLSTALLLVACGGSTTRTASGDQLQTDLPETQESANENDAPEISRSLGTAGGVVVLWPRIVQSRKGPVVDEAGTREIARKLQNHIAVLIRDKLPGVPLDLRPEPERVCPRSGCAGVSVGILLTRAGQKGCSATAYVSPQGPSPARLVPLAGGIKLRNETVGFREPPESHVRVVDHARCESLVEEGAAHDPEVVAAIQAALH